MALAQKKLLNPYKKLRKGLAKLKGQPTPKVVHDVRTRTRCIESTLQALPEASGRNERKLLKHTTEVRRRAGKVRDMDVLSGYARTLDIKGEQDCITELIEHLGAQRYQYAGKLVRVAKQRRPRLKAQLKKTTKKLRRALAQPVICWKSRIHNRTDSLIDTLGEVKDAIGEWHDWEELVAIGEELFDKPHAGCKLVRELASSAGANSTMRWR